MLNRNDSAHGLLRLLLLASIAAPALLVALLGWFTYRAAYGDSRREAVWISGVAREHAARVFDSQELVIDRVLDLLDGMSDDAIKASESEIHDRLKSVIADLPQFLSILVVDRDGHSLVGTTAYPTPRDMSFADRDYFQALKTSNLQSYISEVQVSRLDGRTFFGLARARRMADGSFAGVVNIAISPTLFTRFYSTLVKQDRRGRSGRVLTMIRSDGQILVRYPSIMDHPPPAIRPPNAFFSAIAAAPDGGGFRGPALIDTEAAERYYAYSKVQGYPLYVVAGRSMSAIIGQWQRRMLIYLAAIVPSTIVLYLVTLEVLRRSRREKEALAQAQDEIVRRERAEEALGRAQRLEAVGQLTGGIAHDFNNLLTIIVGNVDIMVRKAEEPERVRRLGQNVLLAAKRVADVTDKLLSFSRRHVVRPEVVDLNHLLGELNPLLARAVSQSVDIVYALEPSLCPVRVDPGQFEAALINLVVNARDAMPNGGRLEIATANVKIARDTFADAPELVPGDFARVSVADSGFGMDEATLGKAFEPFFTTKEVGKGTGLGLSQVYGFAKQAGGHVRIVSREGCGTLVEILLPRTAGELGPDRPKTDAAPPRRAQRGEVVLVVEDETAVLDMAIESLQELGYRTLRAGNAAQALAQLKEAVPVDLLFSDIVMPGGMDGIELVRQALALRPRLSVLLTSGYADLTSGSPIPEGVPLMRKPYMREDLAAEIGKLLAQAQPVKV